MAASGIWIYIPDMSFPVGEFEILTKMNAKTRGSRDNLMGYVTSNKSHYDI